MKKAYRWACLALVAALTFSSVAGCHHKEAEETFGAVETSETTTAEEVNEEDPEGTSETTE